VCEPIYKIVRYRARSFMPEAHQKHQHFPRFGRNNSSLCFGDEGHILRWDVEVREDFGSAPEKYRIPGLRMDN